MTGTIKNAVGHTEFNELKTDVVANGKTIYKDVSRIIPAYHSNVQSIPTGNSCYIHRFGNMISLSVCFNIINTGVPAGSGVFGFIQGYSPSANTYCIFSSNSGYSVPLHIEAVNGVVQMVADGDIPAGFYRGIMTYTINATEEQ